MQDYRIINHAKILVDYSLKVKKGQTIIISANANAYPLIKELYKLILQKQAFPRLKISFEDFEKIYFDNAKDIHLKTLSKISLYEAKNCDGYISIISSYNTKALSTTDPKKIALQRKTNKPVSDIIVKQKNWVITLFPTSAIAQDADLSLEEFENFVYKALFADKKNPIKEWLKVKDYQEKLKKLVDKTDKVQIVSRDTDLTFSIKNRIAVNSCGIYNMPSGEVFTAPVEDSANGYIRYNFPVCMSGKEVEDVYLEFKKGKVIKATAAKNEDFLNAMINIDKGARYIGELGIGTNKGIQKFIKNILFDEKIGGSIHLALGQSYEECKGKNKSALHWDMIKDLRTDGEIYFDNKKVFSKGKWLLK